MKKLFLICVIFMTFFPVTSRAMPSVSAESAIVIESSGGKILFSKNARKKLPMASTTKIMTAICAIEELETDKIITVNDNAVGIEGSSVYLEKDERISIESLLYAMMLNSGNDASVALAYETTGGVESFCELMNKKAKKIGAKDTSFTNPSGLWDENHYTTAYDLALITRYGLQNELFSKIVSADKKTIFSNDGEKQRQLSNHNRLLRQYTGCTGVKTGYTKKCGRCLVSSAKRDGVELVCVTLNAPDDWQDHASMLDYGFSLCKSFPIAKRGDYCRTIIEPETKDAIKLCFSDDLCGVAIESATNNTELVFDIKDDISLPLTKGEKLGSATLYIDSIECGRVALLSAHTIKSPEKRGFREAFLSNISRFFSLHIG